MRIFFLLFCLVSLSACHIAFAALDISGWQYKYHAGLDKLFIRSIVEPPIVSPNRGFETRPVYAIAALLDGATIEIGRAPVGSACGINAVHHTANSEYHRFVLADGRVGATICAGRASCWSVSWTLFQQHAMRERWTDLMLLGAALDWTPLTETEDLLCADLLEQPTSTGADTGP